MSTELTRRRFLYTGAAASIAALPSRGVRSHAAEAVETPPRRFYTNLSLGRMGFHASFDASVELAAKYGFEGVDPDLDYFCSLQEDQLRRVLDQLQAKKLRLGAAGLPVNFRQDDTTFNAGLKKLPTAATALQRVGIRRVSTWIMPCSQELSYLQNFRQHADRLHQCAQILGDHGLKLGLEYVAPRTLWRSERHPFLHTLGETRELLVAIGANNLGIQLDSWHWFNAEETAKDLLTLRGTDVVTVDLNDAPLGLTLDGYQDDHRELPAATGIIPIAEFLGALLQIGYDGPVQAEPFNAALRALPVEQACAKVNAAIKTALDAATHKWAPG